MNPRFPLFVLFIWTLFPLATLPAETVGTLPSKNVNTNPPATAFLNQQSVAQYAYNAQFRGFGLVMSVAICAAESSGYADAINRNAGSHPTDDLGLWQVNDYYHTDAIGCATDNHVAFHAEKLYDVGQYGLSTVASYNATAAYSISSGGTNWHPWTTFLNGMAFSKISANGSTIRSTAASLDGTVITGVGNAVRVNSNAINVRDTPGGATVVRTVDQGALGTITAGPSSPTPVSGQSYS